MRTRTLISIGLVACLGASALGQELVRPSSAMLRHPDVSSSHVVFGYANDIWLVPREGGVAVPVASPDGPEDYPRFSPDGKHIAFVGNYEGNRDIYTVPTAGGPAVRVTHHPGSETLNDWTASDGLLFYTSGLAGYRRLDQLFTIDPSGGMYEKLPVPYGAKGSISSDGEWLAYTPVTRDERTWKRYVGGWATDVWLFNLDTYESRQITTWEGTDTQPYFFGRKVYYLSDAGDEHRLNVWSYDVRTEQREQLTSFEDYDVKTHSVGPGPEGKGEIVLQHRGGLYLLDLSNNRLTEVDVQLPGDRRTLRAERVDFSKNVMSRGLSPSGKRVLLAARGDLWSVPASKGVTRHLTHGATVADRDAHWAPDGKHIAFLSDASGEYEVHVMPADRSGDARQLTELGEKFKYIIGWSPDSSMILLTDNTGRLMYVDAESGEVTQITRDMWGDPIGAEWSHDSSWIALRLGEENYHETLWLYEVATGELTRVTHPMFNVSDASLDRKGEWLFFTTNRHFSPTLSQMPNDITFTYEDTEVIAAVPLREDVESPMLPEGDEEPAISGESDDEEADEENGENSDDENGDDEDVDESDEVESDSVEAMDIDLDGFERRAFMLEAVGNGNFGGLMVNNKGALIYSQGGDIKIFDMSADEPKVEDVIEGAFPVDMTPDGKKLLVMKGGSMHVIPAKKGAKAEDAVPTGEMKARVHPRDEWTQIFNDAWRLFRDYFYDEKLHGVDWEAIREQYAVMLDDCVVRDDLTFVIQEMISELNVGHAYYRPGSQEDEPREGVGLLGVEFALDTEGEAPSYRIETIMSGAEWDIDARSPLDMPGVDVSEGDYLLAVNGRPVDTSKDPWAAFVGLSGSMVSLTVSDKPVMDGDAREVLVETSGSDYEMRFRNWIESMREYVDRKSDGKIGYVYIQNVVNAGLNDTYRQFFGQIDKEAMIIDERWNGGGYVFLPERLVEMFSRKNTNYWSRRDGRSWNNPTAAHYGPKALMINGLSASGGDLFPYLWRQAGIGPLVGTRTWGGLVGLSGNPGFVDGTSPSIPTFGFYENDGTWGIEGYGVDPDIEVVDDPAKMVNGGDPQLDAAIRYLLAELERNPTTRPERPEGPDRSGMGIAEEDK